MRPEYFVTSSHDCNPWEQFATRTLSPLQYFGTLNSLAQPNLCGFVKFLDTITAQRPKSNSGPPSGYLTLVKVRPAPSARIHVGPK